MAGSDQGLSPFPQAPRAAPRWDLSPIYPSPVSTELAEAKARMSSLSAAFLAHVGAPPGPGSPDHAALAAWLLRALELEEDALSLHETLAAYAYCGFSTATDDAAALALLNAVEDLGLPLKQAAVRFRKALATRASEVEALIAGDQGVAVDPRVADFAFHLREELFWQSKEMSGELEELAADLQRSGGEAWSRLQESMTSGSSAVWDAGTGEVKTLVELRNLAYDADRAVREKAFRLELSVCKSIEVPVAASLNGVKGFTVSLNARRGWAGALEKSIGQSRMTRKALDALIDSLESSLPSWRRYLAAKARILGLPRLGFFDLFAPVGAKGRSFTFPEARDFIVDIFSSFDPEMGGFASRAFAESWIDAEPRKGKVGGAYCIDLPRARACRVLCNFDGSFNSVNTIAHELGHAWHAERVRALPHVYTQYPMTLAETASIFSETLVFDRTLKAAAAGAARGQRLGLIELHLQDACQVIVDILSRFYFERSVFERRPAGELAPELLCELMRDAQRRTYGEALDGELLHPYMWLVKGHYYSPGLSYYNFPYAFGQLFGAGLFARYEAEGPSFVASYRRLLEDTGRASAVEVAARAGFDIEDGKFWREGLALFDAQVSQFEEESWRNA